MDWIRTEVDRIKKIGFFVHSYLWHMWLGDFNERSF